MYKVLFFIFLFFIFHYLFFSAVKNDTISIFGQNITNQTEHLNATINHKMLLIQKLENGSAVE